MVYNAMVKLWQKREETAMPWKERIVSQMREDFVKDVLAGRDSKSALCRQYGISRPTGDKWIKRYLTGQPMEDLRRTPHSSPTKTPADTEQLILDARNTYGKIGAAKIHRILQDQGHDCLPSARTVNRILKRNNMISEEASQAATPYQRFEKENPNEMWQADYKGHFAMKDGNRCHPLNIIDDCSRFNLCCEAQKTETFFEIKPVMIRLFQEYGLPNVLLCDNGNPWGTQQTPGYTQFEVWLMELGILTIHGRIRHPQTQGKDESFNRSMTKELLKGNEFENIEDAQRQFDRYRQFYNEVRPHYALGLDTPASHYFKSNRQYPGKIEEWIYPENAEVRRVKSTGYFNWKGQGYYLSEAFGNKEIMIKEIEDDGCINLYFREFKIAKIDIEQRGYIYRRAYLIEGDPRTKSII